jgi:hypothetical protein
MARLSAVLNFCPGAELTERMLERAKAEAKRPAETIRERLRVTAKTEPLDGFYRTGACRRR